jgi:hypothetical protein
MEIQRSAYNRFGKPEPLKFDLAGFWSGRIDQEHISANPQGPNLKTKGVQKSAI